MRKVSQELFLSLFHPSLHDKIARQARLCGATHIVRFVNMQFDSSSFGCSTAVMVGPTCTYTSVDQLEGGWLHDLPSQRQYPQEFCEVSRP